MVEPVLLLPTKCIVDERLRLRETPELLEECSVNQDSSLTEAVLKVKMTGISYNKDFELFKLKNFPGRPVVPGNKIIGKLHQCSEGVNLAPGKYIIFPYSNCLLQHSPQLCENCQFLKDTSTYHLSYKTYPIQKDYTCLYSWEYGLTLDGGLQDYIKVRSPEDSLIKVPDTISLHDSCFLLDLALPLYSFLKEVDVSKIIEDDGKILIVLNDTTREANDILIVLKHFNISQKQVKIMDSITLDSLSMREKEEHFRMKYKYSLIFNTSPQSVDLGVMAVSTGLEATKSRYHIVLFDQYNPQSLLSNKSLHKINPDITVHHFKLSFKDRLNCVELINIISQLNLVTRASNKSQNSSVIPEDTFIHKAARPSVTSIDTSSSSISECSINSNSTSNTSLSNKGTSKPMTKTLRFREDDSIIDPPTHVRSVKNYSWLWYEKDFNLCNEHDQSDDEDTRCHSVKQINRLIRTPNNFTRVCYTKKPRQTNINALLLN